MKNNYFLIGLFLLIFNHSYSAYYFQVSGVEPLTGGQSYLVNQPSNPLELSILVCAFGNTQPSYATSYTLTWYKNTVNSTAGGVMVSQSNYFTVNQYNLIDIKTYLPNTSQEGTFYYYAVLSNPSHTSCGFTGTLTSTIQTVNVHNPATHLNFDGVNDYVSIPSGINVSNSSFTIEFNAKRTATDVVNYVLTQGVQVNNNLLHIGFRDNNNFTFAFWYNDINIPVTNYIADSEWHHWSCVYNITNGTRQVYQDGVLVGSDSNVVPYTGNGSLDLGAFNGSSAFFNGNIEDVRIWNVARTATQINASKNCELVGTETGLLAYYKFNQGLAEGDNTAITTLTDATSNGNNGTLTNFTLTGTTSNFLAGSTVTTGSIVPSNATVTTPVTYNQGATATSLTATTGTNGSGLVWYTSASGGTGVVTAPTPSTTIAGNTSYWVSSSNANGCESARTEIVVTVNAAATHLNFDGVDDYVNCGNTLPLQISGNQITLQAMIYPTSWKNQIFEGSIIVKEGTNGDGYWLRVGQNGSINTAFGNGSQAFQTSTYNVLSLNVWQQITVTYDGATVKIYLDGTLIDSVPNTFSIVSTTSNLLIGSSEGYTNRNFPGSIDEVRIWNKALSATDITNTLNCELQSAEIGLVAYYKFNQGFDATDNTAITTLADASGNSNTGTLTNFALTGASSNWSAGSTIVTGNTCTTLNVDTIDITSNINVYPNPTNGNVNVAVNNLTNVSISVYDLNGRQILNKEFSANENTVDMTSFQTGLYLFRIKSTEGETIKKVIKK